MAPPPPPPPPAPSVVFGVHLGASSASLAVFRGASGANGSGSCRVDVVANEAGDRLTPATVAFTDREILVGGAAEQQRRGRNGANVVVGVKRYLGAAFDDNHLKGIADQSTAVVDKNGAPHFEVELKGKRQTFSAVDVTASIFKDLLKLGQSNSGSSSSKDVVLSCPSESSPSFRRDLIASARAAGFNVLRVVKEPVAAVLAYGLGQETRSFDPLHAVVLRAGGRSTEASVVAVQNGLIRLMTSRRNDAINGDLFTASLSRLLGSDFRRKTKLDPEENKRSKAKLWNGAEITKNILSTLESAQCSIESLCEGVDLHSSVTRGRYEALITSSVQDCVNLMKSVVADAAVPFVSHVILCGAVARTPALQRAVTAAFRGAEVLDSIAPDEVIANGCAVQASLISASEDGDPRDIMQDETFDCLTNSIYVRSSQDATDPASPTPHLLFSKFSPLGFCRNSLSLDSPKGRDWFCLEVLEEEAETGEESHSSSTNGEKPRTENGSTESSPDRQLHPCRLSLVARLVLKGMSTEATEVSVTAHLKKEGGLLISCSDKKSGTSESLLIEAES